jgi:hypothetical protein
MAWKLAIALVGGLIVVVTITFFIDLTPWLG